MRLKRLADEVQTRVSQELFLRADGSEPLDDFEMDATPPIEIEGLDEAMRGFRGRDLRPTDDAAMALTVRGALALTARQAADRNVWWWLTLRRYPDIVRSRWVQTDGDGRHGISAERMLGQVNRNAFARLWWGAEMVQALEDPGKYTRLLFGNQDLFEAVIGRSLGRYPFALQVLLDELGPMPGKVARELVRDLRYLLSTLVLEALTPTDLQKELQQLTERRKSASQTAPAVASGKEIQKT